MSVKLYIIADEAVGKAFVGVASKTFNGNLPLETHIITTPDNTNLESLQQKLRHSICESMPTDGVLVLTDMFGSTPCNVACRLLDITKISEVSVVTGLNLPMLIRVMNYPFLTLSELTEKAVSAGREGVIECCKKR